MSRFVDTLLNHPPIRTRTVEAIAAGADAGWIVCFPVAHGSFVETVKAARRPLDGLALVVLTKRRILPFNLSPIGFGAHQVASGVAHSEIGELLLTVLEREHAAPKAVLLRQLGQFTNAETIPGRRLQEEELAPNEAMASFDGNIQRRDLTTLRARQRITRTRSTSSAWCRARTSGADRSAIGGPSRGRSPRSILEGRSRTVVSRQTRSPSGTKYP